MANLNETVSEIKETFADIRSAIIEKGVEVGECESPTVYAERILDIQSGSGESGISTISADAEAYEVYGEPEASVEITDADDGSTRLAFKFGIARGRTGAQGEKGEDGAPGATGRPGKDAVTFEYIYKLTNSSYCTAPNYSPQQDGYEPENWSKEVPSVSDNEQYVFESRRQKVNNVWSSWSTPAIWAKWGVEGKDGKGIEYIYCLGNDPSKAPKVPDSQKNDEDPNDFPLVSEDGTKWYDNPQNVSEKNSICWVSIRKQKEVDDQLVWGDYSTPAIWAKWGKDGKEGGGRIVFVFNGTETLVKSIDKPRDITWDPTTNVITIPEDSEWKANVDDVKEKYKWVSTASFSGAGTISSAGWSEPFCMTGEDGKPGDDGDSRQFIFRKISNLDNFNTLYNFHRTQKELYDSTNGLEGSILGDSEIPNKLDKLTTVPEDLENWNEVDGYYTIVDTEWTDDATGVDPDNYRIEASCSRSRTNGKWSEWSLPTIWSKWGEDGTDGAGIEYVYKITPVPEPEEKEDGTLETFDEAVERVRYNLYNEILLWSDQSNFQSDSFLENINGDEIWNDWTDEPQDVGPNEPWEWVSIRRKKTNGSWSDFEEPKIWSKWTDDASSCFTSIIFTRAEGKPGTPTGGSYQNPNPGGIWYDSLPAKDNNNGKIWMSQRTFCYPNEIDNDWSDPLEMADSDRFQVEFSLGYENADGTIDIDRRPYPKNFGEYTTEDEWRNADNQKNWNWTDGDIANPVWMITCNRVDGKWTDWSVMRVLAEKGDKGDTGTSVKIEGKFDSLDKLKAEWEKYKSNPETYAGVFVLPLEQGDGYLVDGFLYVYSGHYDDDTTFEDSWLNAGQIKGEPGDDAITYELFISYSDSSDGNPMKDDGDGGKYIGTLSTFKKEDGSYDKDPRKYNSYTWSPWSGEDGWGYEQIFLCTSATSGFDFSNPLPIPTESKAVLDFRPKHDYEENVAHGETDDEGNAIWSDRPIPTSAEWPYCWSVSRKVKGSEFGEWAGAKYGDIEGAEIYDRYIRDGHEIYHLELSEDQIDIPMDGDMVDEDFDREILTTATLYIGNDLEDNNVTYRHTGPINCITIDDGILKISDWNKLIGYSKITITASVDNQEVAEKAVYLHFTPNAYSLSTDVKVLTRDLINDTVSPNQVTVTAKKWNGKEWLPAIGYYITVDCNHLSSDFEKNHTNRDYELNPDGTYTIHLSDESSLSSIDIYLKKDTNDNSANLAWEHIGVVQNGEDGTNIEYIYLLKNEEDAPDNPTPLNESGEPNLGEDYQNPEWRPSNSDWKDNPQNVSTTNKYQYVSVRERKNGTWGPFSDPVLWSVYSEKGDDAISYKHAFAFCRTNSDISNERVTGGTFADPKPNAITVNGVNISWEDSVPTGEAQLWMVSCIVDSQSNTCTWSSPKLMTDTADLQIEYTLRDLGELNDYSPIKFDDKEVLKLMVDDNISQEDAWRKLEAEFDEKVVWDDNVPNALYMAIATCHNGVWNDWSIVRIKGEPGEKGDAGTSVNIVGSACKVTQDPTTLTSQHSTTENDSTKYWNYLYYNNSMYYWNESAYKKIELDTDDTGTGIIIDGDLYVWDGDSWENVGQVRGPAGTSSHLYIKRANSESPSSFNDNGKYIGYYVSETVMTDGELEETLSERPSKWNWTKWNGDDGWGYEEIFLLTKRSEPFDIPTDSQNIKDYCPKHDFGEDAFGSVDKNGNRTWSDIFLLPNETYPYCWKVKRNVTVSNYAGAWYGDKNRKAILCDVYVKDGVSAYHLELTNDQGIIPIENGKEEDVTLETTMMLYAGDTLIDEEDGVEYSIEYGNTNESLDSGSISISNSELTNIETITCVATHNGNQFKKEFKILRTENAYEIRPNVEVFHRDLSTNMLTNGNCKVYVSKWNHYRDLYQSLNGKKLYFTCYDIDGEELTIGGHSYSTINNGVASFNLSNIPGIGKVEFYLVLSNNTHISEVVGVVTNGNDSYASEAIYILGTEEDIPLNPTPIESQRDNYDSPEWLPEQMFDEDQTEYTNQKGEIITKEIALQWSDNPLTINDTDNYCYVSIRKFNTNTKTWGDFSDPVPYSCKVKGDDAISSSITVPTLFKKQSDNTLVNKTIYVNVNSYIGSRRRKIKSVAIDGINNDKIRYDDYMFEFDYDSSIDDSTITFDVTIRFDDDEGILRELMTCNVYTKVDGENAISPIAVHLSNPSMELSWFANGDVITNHAECIITSMRGNTPLPIRIGNVFHNGFQISYSKNNTTNVTVEIIASSKIPPGQYTISLPLTIAGTTLIRDINVTVKEIPNANADVILDQTVWMPYISEKIVEDFDWGGEWWNHLVPPVLGTLVLWAGQIGEDSRTYYRSIPGTVDITNIRAFVNGIPKTWSVDNIALYYLDANGEYQSYYESLSSEHYKTSSDFIIIRTDALLKNSRLNAYTHSYFRCDVTFNVEGEVVTNSVYIYVGDPSGYSLDFKISPKEATMGSNVDINVSVTDNYTESWYPLNHDLFKDHVRMRVNGSEEGYEWTTADGADTVYNVPNVSEDIIFEFDKKNGDKWITVGTQKFTCHDVYEPEIWSIKAANPFVKVTHNAIEGSGEFVGSPISLIIQHQIGDKITSYGAIPDGYKMVVKDQNEQEWEYATGDGLNDIQDPDWLYKNLSALTFILQKEDGSYVDSVTIEKTIVYPEPIIYPAGSYDPKRTYKLDYYRVPYISVKTASDIKYYVANRDILTNKIEYNISINTLTISGDTVTSGTHNGYPIWKQMESFEAIYADIGVFKQALVGPMVFYKDWVFSKDGMFCSAEILVGGPLGENYYRWIRFKDSQTTYTPGMAATYDVLLDGVFEYYIGGTSLVSTVLDLEEVIKCGAWKPNYLLNATTGQFYLMSHTENPSTIQLGQNITLGGEKNSIVVKEQLKTNGISHEGILSIGDENKQAVFDAMSYVEFPTEENVKSYATKSVNIHLDGNTTNCYGGSILSVRNYNSNDDNIAIPMTHCISTENLPGVAAISCGSTSGVSILNQSGGIYGFRTGAKRLYNGDTLDLVSTCASFSPQTIIVQNGNTATLKLPSEDYSEIGDCFEIWAAGTLNIVSQKNMYWKYTTGGYNGVGKTPKINESYARIVYTGESWWMVYW